VQLAADTPLQQAPPGARREIAQAAADATRAETSRVRADAEKMLADFRAETAAELAAVRADLRARSERAEAQADAYRAELAQARAAASPDDHTTAKTPRRPANRPAIDTLRKRRPGPDGPGLPHTRRH
jgi:hypothetical protein